MAITNRTLWTVVAAAMLAAMIAAAWITLGAPAQAKKEAALPASVPAASASHTLEISSHPAETARRPISADSKNGDGGEPDWPSPNSLPVLDHYGWGEELSSTALAITRNSIALVHEPGPTTTEMTEDDLQDHREAVARNVAVLDAQVDRLRGKAHSERITNIRNLTSRISSNAERVADGRAPLLEAIRAYSESEWRLTGANAPVMFRTASTVTDRQFHHLMGQGEFATPAGPDREDALRYSHWKNLSSDLMLAHALLEMSSLLEDPKPLAQVRESYDSAADRIRQDLAYLDDNSRTEAELDLLELAKPVLKAGSGENNHFDLLERMLELKTAEKALLDDSAEALVQLAEEMRGLTANPRAKPATATAPAPAAGEPGVGEDEILFGQSAALTRPSGALGQAMRLGIETAFAEANRNGGVHGREVTLASVNDRYEPDSAAAATEYLLEDKQVFALIGAVGTPTSRAAVPLASAAGAPFIGPFTGAQFLRNPELENVINLRASYHQETEEMVERLTQDLGISHVAVLYQNDSFGLDGLEGTRMALERRELEPAASWYYHRNTEAVLSATMRIADAEPEAVIIVGSYAPAARAIEVLRERMEPDPIFAAVSFVGSAALAETLEGRGEGVYVTQVMPLPDGGTALAERYRDALKSHAPAEEPGFVSLEGYLAGRLALAGLEACGTQPTRECFLEAVRNLDGGGIDGFELDYGPEDNQGSDAVFITVMDAEGQFREVKELAR